VRIPSLLRAAILVPVALVKLTALAPPAFSQAQVDSAAVAEAIERFHQALAKGDSAAALMLLGEDAIVVESGSIESRQEYRSHHLPADVAFARAVKERRSPVRLNVRGDVAWATATSTTRGDYRGRKVNSTGAELMVLTRAGPGWKINAIHWSSRNLP
jgi:ketosteroid isomerase-like protein